MSPVVWVVVVVLLALVAGLTFYFVRTPAKPSPVVLPPEVESPGEHDARMQALETRGNELLKRRIELEASRGTLGGQSRIYKAFEDLENRLRAGEISEDEFEKEKISLLEQGF